ncbi:MAG: phosphate acyltransferase [Candidatus Zixiibacteriota bacterium]
MNLPEMHIPDINTFEHIYKKAVDRVTRSAPCRAALMLPADGSTLQAFYRAVNDKLIQPTVIGNRTNFNEACADENIQFGGVDFIAAEKFDGVVSKGAELAAGGKIDLLVNGAIPVADILGRLFKAETGFIQKKRTVSHIALLKPEKYKKLLFLTDSAVVVQPDLQTKLQLIDNIIELTGKIGLVNPRIALLAAVEVIYPQMPVTMEAAIIAKMAERRQIKGAFVDGPLSFDIAVDMFAAHAKGVTDSEVAGQADALIAPNIEVANGVYKGMSLYGKCQMGGVIVGGRVPIALGSRSDNADNKYNSLVLGVLAA